MAASPSTGSPDMPIERQGEGRRLQAVLGSGAGNLRIRTGDGTITLKRSYIPVAPAPPHPPRPRRAPAARRHDANKGRGTGNKSEGRQGTSHGNRDRDCRRDAHPPSRRHLLDARSLSLVALLRSARSFSLVP